jgi:NodT family efflux transporter outer membrane factor (OMF) lipoprotein
VPPCLLLFSACTVGPDFKRPEAAVPAQYELPAIDPAAQTSAPTAHEADVARWWAFLNDPVLTSLVERASVSNLNVAAAEARIRQARAARGAVASGLLPSVDVSASASRSRSPVIGVPGKTGTTNNFFRTGLDASWELDIFGGTRRAVEAADAGIEASLEDRRDVLVTLVAEVALNYTDLRGLQEELRVARENLDAQEKTLDITRRRLAAGFETTRLDLANAEAQVASTRSAIPGLRAGVRQAIFNLGVLLGREPTALEAELDAATPIPKVPPTVPAGLPSDLLRRRSDIRRAEAQAHQATAQIGVATADLYPRFSLTGALGVSSTQLDSLLEWDRRAWSAGGGVLWPLFAGGRIRAGIAAAEAAADATVIAYRAAVLNALLEVQIALENYAREQERHASLVDAVDANRRAVQMATRLYSEGQTDFLNVLSAQRSLFGAEESLSQSTRTLTTDLITLYKALGGGWERFED